MLAIRSQEDGSANCWGDNAAGAIDPTGPDTIFPPHRLLDSNLSNTDVAAVGAGLLSTCVAESSEVFCRGTVATQTAVDSPLPGGAVTAAIAVGREHVCLADDAGEVWCAGSNEFAQLGTGGTPDGFARVSIPPGARQIAAHRDSTCALTSDGLWCWGRNNGHVAPGSGPTAPPTRVSPDSGTEFVDFAIGTGTSCAIGDDAFFYCWGTPLCGDLEFTGVQRLEFLGDAAAGASSITVGSAFMCFIADDRVYCWGQRRDGSAWRRRFCRELRDGLSRSSPRVQLKPARGARQEDSRRRPRGGGLASPLLPELTVYPATLAIWRRALSARLSPAPNRLQ